MDDVTTLQVPGLSEGQALERIIAFAQRFGYLHADLASHAAFPLVLTPDLLYRIWASFLPQIPWTTVADILLSPLCREVGYELYEMDPAIRNILLRELREDVRFGEARLGELAGFLEEYIQLNWKSEAPDQRDLAEAQHLTALANTAPDRAAHEIAEKLSDTAQLEGSELLRVATLTESLAAQLGGYSLLIRYARGVERLAHGDQQTASSLLNRVFEEKEDIEIAGVTLQRPRPVPDVRQAQVEEETIPPVTEAAVAPGAPNIFISYRRADSGQIVGRIRDRLATAFGEGSVLRDLESIPVGVDFRTALEREIQSCRVMLAVIGPQWTEITDTRGKRRLFDPGDYTRIEIEAGLRNQEVILIPVLVMNARFPTREEVPESLRDLLYRNAISIRNDPDFENDMERLVEGIRQLQGPTGPAAQDVTVDRQVYISYAWGGEHEEVVNQIDNALQQRGIKILRDKRDLGYQGSLSEFLGRIGRGNCVVAVISDKYLRSPNCMTEWVEIAENEDKYDRVFPIVLADADIYDPVKRIEYVKYWEGKRAELAEAMKSLDPANLQGIREDMDLYDRIRDKISGLTSMLKGMHTLTPEMHRGSDFSALYDAIEKRLPEETVEGEREQGESLRGAKPARLPEELVRGMNHEDRSVRERTVQQLSELLTGENIELAGYAREALERLEQDDSRMVSQAATRALAAVRQAEQEGSTEAAPGIGGSQAQQAAELVQGLKQEFQVEVQAYRSGTGSLLDGWTLAELERLHQTLALVANLMGGNEAFIRNLGGLSVQKEGIGGHGGEASAHRINFSTRGSFSAWTLVHEIAHAWDANYDWRFARLLEKYTGGFTNRLRSISARVLGNWDAGPNGPENKPGRYGRLPGCNRAGYFYGDTPSGSNWNFNRIEDFAESVTMYVGWERGNELSEQARNRIARYTLQNGERDRFGVIDNWANYAKYFYPVNGDYSKTKRWQFIDDLIKGNISLSDSK